MKIISPLSLLFLTCSMYGQDSARKNPNNQFLQKVMIDHMIDKKLREMIITNEQLYAAPELSGFEEKTCHVQLWNSNKAPE